MYWEKLSQDKVKEIIFDALQHNQNYRTDQILGLPATYLDSEEFYPGAPFLQNAPYLSALVANPNHIGCHTMELSQSEDVFKGTHEIELDLLRLCAEQVLNGNQGEQDGYVATGGTEGNIQAMWVYRNYFINECAAKLQEIAVVYSEDTHYSIPKGVNILGISSIIASVNNDSREVELEDLRMKLKDSVQNGCKYFILIVNMGTTMFGSIDDLDKMSIVFDDLDLNYKVHADAAFGGFIYPFSNHNNKLSFQHPKLNSIVLDGHKMLQAPYGTGVFLIRKEYLKYVCTKEARYIPGKDYTLCGSRSGANAIVLWMIMKIRGSEGWKVKIHRLVDRTTHLCSRLRELGVEFYRNPFMNIVAIRSEFISEKLAEKYKLMADRYDGRPAWWKIVVMSHVKQGVLDQFITDLKADLYEHSKSCTT